MTRPHDDRFSTSWAALPILERLAQPGGELTSEEVAQLLRTRSVSGIASTMSWSRTLISEGGIRFDEAVIRRRRQGKSIWTAGPRIAQALNLMRLRRQGYPDGEWGDDIPVEDIEPGDPRPALVLRTIARRGKIVEFQGTIANLEEIVDDPELDLSENLVGFSRPGEIFIERIEPGADGRQIEVPPGYEENGLWVRGTIDGRKRAIAGRRRFAYIKECAWFERRLALVDAKRQVDELHARNMWWQEETSRWKRLDDNARYRHVQWIAADPYRLPRSAPPLHLRLRCWRTIAIEPDGEAPTQVMEEGLRRDDERTADRAIRRWRSKNASRAGVPVTVRSVKIARRQPKPRCRDALRVAQRQRGGESRWELP